jgi:hypothetical protein
LEITQRTFYAFVTLKKGRSHDLGLTKVESDFEHSPEHSILRGDKLSASKQKVDGDVFRTNSHNPNGLSCSDDNLDVKQFAKAIHAKDVALVNLYEVNRNFQKQSGLNSFHHHLRFSTVDLEPSVPAGRDRSLGSEQAGHPLSRQGCRSVWSVVVANDDR